MSPDQLLTECEIETHLETTIHSGTSYPLSNIGYIPEDPSDSGQVEDGEEELDSSYSEEDSYVSCSEGESEEECIDEDAEVHPEAANDYSNPAVEAFDTTHAMQLLATPQTIRPEIVRYIDEIQYQIICIEPNMENEMKRSIHPSIVKKGVLTEPQKRLFKFVNTALQIPASTEHIRSVWDSPRSRRTYKYVIRDYVAFVAGRKFDGILIDETNFHVNGLHVAKCMKDLIEKRRTKVGSDFSGYVYKLSSFRAAMIVLQHVIALYRSSFIEGETEREELFESLKSITFIDRLQQVVRVRKVESREAARNNFEDKAKHHLSRDRYMSEDIMQMVTNMVNSTSSDDTSVIYEGVNAPVELLSGHHCFFRGENKRVLELSDTYYMVQETSRGKLPILVFQLNREKTMGPNGKPRSMGTCRSKDVRMCLVSAYAFSLWFRFDFEIGPEYGERHPNFSDKESWYPHKILFTTRSTKKKKEISYQHEAKLIRKCLDSVGLEYHKATHFMKGASFKNADANDISEDQTKRTGHWATSALAKFYLSPFPFSFMHFVSGFKRDEDYRIARDIDPPDALKKMIFPNLEAWRESVKRSPAKEVINKNGKTVKDTDGEVIEFFKMLDAFRAVILQDLAVWMDISPHSIYCKHEITRHPLFLEFRAQVKNAMANETRFPNLTKLTAEVKYFSSPIHQALRCVASGLENGFTALSHEYKGVRAAMENLTEAVMECNRRSQRQAERLDENDCFQIIISERLERLEKMIDELKELVWAIHSNLSGITSTEEQINSLAQPQKADPRPQNILDQPQAQINAPPRLNLSDPKFNLSENETFVEVVEEWYVTTPARMSIRDRDVRYKSKWRTGARHASYRRKKSVINFLTMLEPKIGNGKLSVMKLARLVDEYRKARKESLKRFIRFRLEKTITKVETIEEIVTLWTGLSDERRQNILSDV